MINKSEAVTWLRSLGLDTTTTVAYPAKGLTAERIEHDFGHNRRYVARTSAPTPALNLPRLLDATAIEIAQWATTVDPTWSVIVQEYGELAFCGQLAVYPGTMAVELVSGMWEMRAGQQPWNATATWNTRHAITWDRSSGPIDPQPCTWLYEPGSTRGHVEDWMTSATRHWIQASTPALQELLEILGHPYGLKIHYVPHTGVSAQNLYSNVPTPDQLHRAQVPTHCPTISDVRMPIPHPRRGEVLLEASVGREEAALFDDLIARLRSAGVTRVYLRSGLLSHAAIRLREAGLTVLPAG